MRSLLKVADLDVAQVETLLGRATELASSTTTGPVGQQLISIVGLLFLSSSLRTRVGFSVAATRLGLGTVEVVESRFGEVMSAAESFEDTLRTLSGMVDLVVVRAAAPYDGESIDDICVAPCISAGSAGADGEHPTQALIDLAAIRTRGEVGDLRIGLCGDLSSRTARSLVRMLEMYRPAELRLMGPVVENEVVPTGPLAARSTRLDSRVLDDLEVLYLCGLPERVGERRFSASERQRFSFDPGAAAALPPGAVVLSPLPVIDEVHPAVRADRRVRMFEQSDFGVFVRMAVLEWASGNLS